MPGTECIILWCLEDKRHRRIGDLHGLAFLGRTYDAGSPDDQVPSQRPAPLLVGATGTTCGPFPSLGNRERVKETFKNPPLPGLVFLNYPEK